MNDPTPLQLILCILATLAYVVAMFAFAYALQLYPLLILILFAVPVWHDLSKWWKGDGQY